MSEINNYTGACLKFNEEEQSNIIMLDVYFDGYFGTTNSPCKVKFVGSKCYVSKDFDMEEDFWQLYPPTMMRFIPPIDMSPQ